MGFTPQEIDQMSVWQYMACVQGYIEANSSDDNKRLDREEYTVMAAQVLALS